ncbi:helicase-associated domain-containing protein [Arthrobacter sp. TMP15]|uniref:helicase-associated domain-containing protein n=1 Tax=Arthrobacter sp. TMP15 TaxID=3140789 RepID=UPI0031BB2B43
MSTLAAFAVELAARSDAELCHLLRLRPDAMTPPVATFADLASRLSTAHSVNLALAQLNLPQLQVLAALPAGKNPNSYSAWLPSLHRLALILSTAGTQEGDKYDGVRQDFLPLAAVAPVLCGSTYGSTPGSTPGPDLEGPLQSLAPVFPLPTVPLSARDNACGSAMETLLRSIRTLIELAQNTPLEALRGGGASVRTVRKVSRELLSNDPAAGFYLELAAMAGLITFDAGTLKWQVAEHNWLEQDRAQQWLQLVKPWLHSPRPTLLNPPRCVDKAASTRPLTGMAHLSPISQSASMRFTVLCALSALAPVMSAGAAAADGKAPVPTHVALQEYLRWRHPRRSVEVCAQLPGVLAELELLGLTGAGALSEPGQAVALTDWDGADAALGTLLPAPIEHFIIQGDLTAVAPGFLAPAVAAQLKLLAVPEGHGAAGIFRFSQASLEGAVSAGMDEEAILGFLLTHSSTAVPQSLSYLISAAAHGTAVPPGSRPLSAGATHQVPAQEAATAEDEESIAARVATQIARLRSQPLFSVAGGGESGPALVMEELRQAIAADVDIWLQIVTAAGERERLRLRPLSLVAGTLKTFLAGGTTERRFSIHRIMATEQAEEMAEPEQPESSDPGKAGPQRRREQHG